MRISRWLCEFARTLILRWVSEPEPMRKSSGVMCESCVQRVIQRKPGDFDMRHPFFIKAYKPRYVLILGCLVIGAFVATTAQASGPIPTVSIGGSYPGYQTPEEACQAEIDLGLRTVRNSQYQTFTGLVVQSDVNATMVDGVLPYNTLHLGGWLCNARYFNVNPYDPTITWVSLEGLIWMYPVCPSSYAPGSYALGSGAATCPSVAQYFVSAASKINADNGSCCSVTGASHVADPVNPANGDMYRSEQDAIAVSSSNSLLFHRFYNSADSSVGDLGSNWRHSYSRSIKSSFNAAIYQPYLTSNADNSSLYNDEATACTNGFAQIKSRVVNWESAVTGFSSGICTITNNGTVIGALPIQSAYKELSPPTVTAVSLDAIRDDGRVTRFTIQDGVVTAPPSINLKLQQTSSGYTLTDASDTVETYDTNGRLLSITSRAGVVQTMSYDASEKLSTVADSFGHQLTLGYDTQNRLITVTRQ
jgi:YD repeat-containing protein